MIIQGMSYLTDPNKQFSLRNCSPNVAGIVKVFHAGTDDPAKTYCDFNGTRNPQDIRLDNNGRAVIIADVSKAYRIEVCNRFGGLLWTVEPAYCIGGEGGGGTPVAVGSPYILTHGTLDKTQSEYGMPLMAMAGSGGDIWLDNANQIRVKPGIYHVDYEAQVFVATEDGDQLQDGIRKVTAILQTATKTHRNSINVDMTYSHTELLQGSYDFKALSESQLMFHLENIGDYVRYSLYGLDVFKISE